MIDECKRFQSVFPATAFSDSESNLDEAAVVGFDGETAEHRRRATIARPHGLLIFLALRCLLYYIRHDESFAPRSMRPPVVAAQVLNVSNI
jgi:hypothetical protein